MRIRLNRNETNGRVDVTIIDSLEHDGEVIVAFSTALVPIIEIEEGVEAAVFVPMATERHNAVDYDKLSLRSGLSIWNVKAPDAPADSAV
jgi:hypothetical protein